MRRHYGNWHVTSTWPSFPPPHCRIWVLPSCRWANSAMAVKLLQQAQRRHPGDFWINHELAARPR